MHTFYNRFLLAILAIFSSIYFVNAQNITISSQEGVDTFNFTEVVNLTISGADITNLQTLSGLREVSGNLLIINNSNLERIQLPNLNISGFENLTSVANFLTIEGNDILESISGFSSLRTTGRDIRIQNNNQLAQITGFGELSNIGVDFLLINLTDLATLTNFPSLTTIGRTLRIGRNTNLERFEFIDLSTVSGNIEITDNGDLTSVS